MSKYFFSLLALILLPAFLFLTSITYASHIPTPSGYINDFAGVLTFDQKLSLENSLRAYDQKTTNEIAVAIVKSLDGGDITDFTVRTFEEWKIGKKGEDNGVLFLVAVDDRKMRIEVGYGLEPYLTDAQAGDIIRNVVAPDFQKGNYYQGISKGISAIENSLGNTPPSKYARIINSAKNIGANLLKLPIHAIGTLVFFVIYILSYMARTKSIWLGGIVGIGIGALWGFITTSLVNGIIALLIFGSVGLLLDWWLSKVFSSRLKNHKGTGWWATGGGFSRGGGFGGFGGGRSGGGGASGGW